MNSPRQHKAVESRLDTLWSKKIRERDKTCAYCRRQPSDHAHHVIHRGKAKHLRWHLDNGLGVCHECHGYIHRQEKVFRKWFEARHPFRWRVLNESRGVQPVKVDYDEISEALK